ncbi:MULTISPECIES: MvaI/BcnI restriction endonuclease family protein [Butyricimonas]|uniref:MvaI/BcnI restriction endonuclease family protein n=1 Tax=Butyricimonas TaxID=574697 RepID=UPI001D0855DF|nr:MULTISPECIES: MvaI/BcnI restriction endonuclease family protein [Butyricimonas]MCB6974323.1 MvaI/BcnI restriction endonuclease family protein [Butyricimonas synergistica]MCG4521117.1 MvaI/BcnI restriction endonuclease family protein [Butyricimonas sp. DFI.6.44]
MENKEFIIEQFKKVKELGYVPSRRKNNTGIGKTFEDYIGVVENNIDEPDLAGYEIKSHREVSQSYVTLFTKSPTFPSKANGYLKDRYGTAYIEDPSLKRLHTSMFASNFNTYANAYSFRLLNNSVEKRITIGIFDINTKLLIDNSVGYTYEAIKRCLERKLKNLFYVTAETRNKDGVEEFYFNRADIYMNSSFERFLELLDTGKIMYDIRIGSYKSGSKKGKPHDHGSGFRILESNLKLLYSEHEIVE